MGTRKVLGMVGWYGMIDSPTPLLVADVVEYQYLVSRGSFIAFWSFNRMNHVVHIIKSHSIG